MAQAGPSKPSKSKKQMKPKGIHSSKFKKVSEAQAIQALEQVALQFVRS